MSILRTIALFVYLFGYMIVHYATLRRAERALAAGDLDTVEQIVKANIPRWSRGILRVTGARMTVEGQKNIPAGPCVFVGNHRSYYDIPILLTALDAPHGILAKEELEKIPLLNRWMKLLGCVFVKRDDIRASVKALNDATAIVESGRSFVIFPEGTRYKGEEGGAGEFKAGAFRIAAVSYTHLYIGKGRCRFLRWRWHGSGSFRQGSCSAGRLRPRRCPRPRRS